MSKVAAAVGPDEEAEAQNEASAAGVVVAGGSLPSHAQAGRRSSFRAEGTAILSLHFKQHHRVSFFSPRRIQVSEGAKCRSEAPEANEFCGRGWIGTGRGSSFFCAFLPTSQISTVRARLTASRRAIMIAEGGKGTMD